MDGVWRTINGVHVLIGKDGTITAGPKNLINKKVSKNKLELGKLQNGEIIRGYVLEGEENGVEKTFYSVKEMYEYMEKSKIADKKTLGHVDKYSVSIETDENLYEGYTFIKYKGRIRLK